ncbi:hypothetical protein HEM75_014520 [Escherichia coli]|nr:hypothetical protein [Escherichia coli]
MNAIYNNKINYKLK